MAVSKVILNGNTLIDTTDKTVTSGGMLSGVTALKNDGTSITGNITTKTSSDLTASGATVTAPAGYYASSASKSVASGSAGTPTATKGAVSNHSISVTPSVTNTTGYITGSTINGTAVAVNVTELESGTKTITENGTGISVSGYSAVDVDVPTGGGSSYTLIATDDFAVTTSSTSVTTVGTLTYSAGSSYDMRDKVICVTAFDKQGLRNGYCYGSTFYFTCASANNTGSVGGGICYRCDNNRVAQTSNKYGVYCSDIVSSSTNNITITISARYSSTYSQTIDGTFEVNAYLLDWPTGTSPLK